MIRLVISAAALTVASAVSGCGGPSVDSACDVEGVTVEVEHMVEESSLGVESVDALECSGTWAVARATISGAGASPRQETFVFEQSDAGWILKAAELVCAKDADPAIPADLADLACA